ncbi:isoprenylcysteine carboxylmethyltransferase family protein [Ruania suaedae]|uniref:methyltransferase family protein n=1 Tax=Ruania suaedae TaxID=2897774 RepID=UPI001E640230|nr:isoprenylcysteine carboxylmethyltransferase family protein [Ruania suaedae]UFU02298.1 isoprenylcysteine carboxylmethyltransferase family protein [Ruania suaedae]
MTSQDRRPSGPHLPPPVILAAAAGLQRLLSRRPASPSRPRRVASAVLALGSIALPMTAALNFRSHRTTISPLDPAATSTLVTSGPNALTRNPMYLGMAGLLVAHALRRGSWPATIPLALFVLVIDRTQIRTEERALEKQFGSAYRVYCAEVPRWLKLLPKRQSWLP